MKLMTKKAQQRLLSVVKLMEHGDHITFDGMTLFVYNSQGCMIDYINCYEN